MKKCPLCKQYVDKNAQEEDEKWEEATTPDPTTSLDKPEISTVSKIKKGSESSFRKWLKR